MPNRNLWNKNVPRVEYDYRARDARLRLERVERLLMRRAAVGSRFGLLACLSATSPVAAEGAADAQGRRMIGGPVALGRRVWPPAEHELRRGLVLQGYTQEKHGGETQIPSRLI